MKHIIIILLTFFSLNAYSQTIYIPPSSVNTDSFKLPIQIAGVVRSIYVVDLTKMKVSIAKHSTDSSLLRSLIPTTTSQLTNNSGFITGAALAPYITSANAATIYQEKGSYLTSYTETDPVFLASVASSITSTSVTNWNTAFSWGNHASAGYLTNSSLTPYLLKSDSTLANRITVNSISIGTNAANITTNTNNIASNTTAIGNKADKSTTITINGVSHDLSTNSTFSVSGGTATTVAQGYGTIVTTAGSTVTVKADTSSGKVLASPYQGKTAYAIGDSYTNWGLYQNRVSTGLGVTVLSDGRDGTNITGGIANTGKAIVSRIDSILLTNPDIVIIEGGTNDYRNSATLGSVNSTDTATFYGAYRYILTKCLAKTYPIKIIPINILQMGTSRAIYAAQKIYSDAINYICNLYGIPVVDAFNGSGITYENNLLFLPDGIHPTTTAGLKQYGDFIVSSILGNSTVNPNLPAPAQGTIDANFNTYFGSNAYHVSTAPSNTGFGYQAGYSNTTGSSNVFDGVQAGYSNTTGISNVAVGREALYTNTTGQLNTAIGYQALRANTTASGSTAVGHSSLKANTTGDGNSAFGYFSLQANTNGSYNSAIGYSSMQSNTTGSYNTAVGYQSLLLGTGGTSNTAVGYATFYSATGGNNTGVGVAVANNVTSGANNTIIGAQSGKALVTGSSNVMLGYEAGYFETGGNKFYVSNARNANLIFGDFSTGQMKFNATTSGAAPTLKTSVLYDFPGTTGGSLFTPMTNTQRDALTSLTEGTFIYSLTDHTYEFWNGTAWKQITTN